MLKPPKNAIYGMSKAGLEGIFLLNTSLYHRFMAKGGTSKPEKAEAPPEILVWSPSEEQEPPLAEEQPTAPAPVSKKPRRDTKDVSEEAPQNTKALPEEADSDTNTDVDKNEVNPNDQFWGFLLIPCLVFSSVLIGLGSDFESISCESYGGHSVFGSITLDGADYNLYTIHYGDLNKEQHSWDEDDNCDLSDWNIQQADEIELMVHTNQYHAFSSCSVGVNDCDGVIFEYGNDWIPMEERFGSSGMPDGYFAFEDGGWFNDGYFAVAVKPSVELSEFEAQATSDPSVPQLIFSIVLTPAALFLANRWAVANDRPDVRTGAVAFAKIVLRVVGVFVPVFIGFSILLLLTW